MEKWRLKLTSAKVEVEVEAELGNKPSSCFAQFGFALSDLSAISTIFRSRNLIMSTISGSRQKLFHSHTV